ncbi:hypothetical protein HY388_00065 [Candidatus Daviesbacteria bacterium]|nr:hypothetical protein [Candidatus Daviesbacteria bacterium]
MELIVQKIIEVAAFLSAFAGIVAALVMFQVTKKFGTGLVASGYRYIAFGVLFIGVAMVIDAISLVLGLQGDYISLFKAILLAIGTYIIVIGTKNTADRLEKLR